MGWWKIDPDTGAPAIDAHSALSQPPDFVLLNSVPGVDDNQSDCYLGDGPWDIASTVPGEIAAITGDVPISNDQLRDLLLRREVPSIVGGESDISIELLRVVDAFWKDIDGCYEDDWERPATAAEKRWICEYVVECRING